MFNSRISHALVGTSIMKFWFRLFEDWINTFLVMSTGVEEDDVSLWEFDLKVLVA
jgi:hypothetical protein